MKQEQRRKTERFTEEEKKQMKREWNSQSKIVFTGKFLTALPGGPPWEDVTWREIVDIDTGIVLEDKPKEAITKRDMTKFLGKKMNLKITLYADKDSYPYLPEPRNSEPGAPQEDVPDALSG